MHRSSLIHGDTELVENLPRLRPMRQHSGEDFEHVSENAKNRTLGVIQRQRTFIYYIRIKLIRNVLAASGDDVTLTNFCCIIFFLELNYVL